MRPDVVLARRDIEIADKDFLATRPVAEPAGEVSQKIKLVGEFVVFIRIRNIAASRNVEIVKPNAAGKAHRDVAPILFPAKLLGLFILDWKFRNDSDAMIAGLA